VVLVELASLGCGKVPRGTSALLKLLRDDKPAMKPAAPPAHSVAPHHRAVVP
jgi:hypothetical protein